jgi:hypothetical protein
MGDLEPAVRRAMYPLDLCRRRVVSKAEVSAKLAQVKLALAAKYDRLAKVVKSVPRRKTYLYQAARFRRQAADLS